MRALLEADPNLVHAQNWYTQPVHFAVYADHPEILSILFDAGAEPSRTRFMASGGKELLEHGADIDATEDEFHGTPLAWAARGGHGAAVRLLLEHGADPDLPVDIPQAQPLACARAGGHERVVELLKRVRDG